MSKWFNFFCVGGKCSEIRPVLISWKEDKISSLKRYNAVITISYTERILQDQTLIHAIKQGDQIAFQSLVRQYQDRIFHVCLSFVPVQEDAEDLAQEVFVEVFRSINSFRGDSKLGTWIHRIAISKSLELQRYRKRQKRQAFFKSLVGLDEPAVVNVGSMMNHPGIMLVVFAACGTAGVQATSKWRFVVSLSPVLNRP